MKILATDELVISRTVYVADYITYDDGCPLSTTRNEYDSEEERLEALKEYGNDMLDIDTDEHEYGWQFSTATQYFKVTIEVVQDDNGKIIIRQKDLKATE